MPWCEPCRRYLAPNSVNPDGTCPQCGKAVEPAPDTEREANRGRSVAERPDRIPWHFWVVMVLAGVYLGWRLVQGIALLF